MYDRLMCVLLLYVSTIVIIIYILLLYLYVYTVVRDVILHYAAFRTYASILQSMRYICIYVRVYIRII